MIKLFFLLTLIPNIVFANTFIENNRLKIKTSSKHGGAITSILFRGEEIIDSSDNGRLFQSAVSYNNLGEDCNPTQGGDITNKKTSKLLMEKNIKKRRIMTLTDMAYWHSAPEDIKCERKENLLSTETFLISPYTILTTVTYHIPNNYDHATFEALTGYMVGELSESIFYDSKNMVSIPTKDFIGEQRFPVIHYSVVSNKAVGIFSPALPQNWFGDYVGYGRFFYTFTPVTKFNCVFRENNLRKDESRTFQCMTVIGTLDEVKKEIDRLTQFYTK